MDLAMIAAQVPGIDAAQLQRHVASEQARRLTKGSLRAELPRRLELASAQVDDWRRR